MRFSKAVVKCRVPILILTLLLMIPAVLGGRAQELCQQYAALPGAEHQGQSDGPRHQPYRS